MVELKQEGPAVNTTVANMLGISQEMASSCLATGHITLTDDNRHTFIRLRDFYQIIPKSTRAQSRPIKR